MDVGMDGKGLLVIDYEVGRVVDKQQAGLQVGWMMGGLITVYWDNNSWMDVFFFFKKKKIIVVILLSILIIFLPGYFFYLLM